MTYASVMVQLELEHPNDARLQVAGDLAERLGAKVIGIAACSNQAPAYFAEGAFAQKLIDQDRKELERRLAEVRERFEAATRGRTHETEWRCALSPPTEYVAAQARSADLIITGANRDGTILDPARRVDASALVLTAGRPAIIVPPAVEWLRLKNVLVCWKEAREARRAIVDALPLLRLATAVKVVEVVEDDSPTATLDRLKDVTAWLGRHGVGASTDAPMLDGEPAEQIEAIADDFDADVVIAGAYGHTRFSEWVFGGVTRELLMRSKRCALLSH